MLIGYARVSTRDQKLKSQEDALKQAGCEKIFTDVASGAKTERPGLAEAFRYSRKGDSVVVWSLDRLGRSLHHLIETVMSLKKKGIGFRSLQEGMDTTTSGGKLVFHIFGALAEFEREIIRERTRIGLEAAREMGRTGGRPKAMDEFDVKRARRMFKDKNYSIKDICELHRVSRATLYRYLNIRAK